MRIGHIVPKGDYTLWKDIEKYYFAKGYRWTGEEHNFHWCTDIVDTCDTAIIIDTDNTLCYSSVPDNYKEIIQPFCIVPEDLFVL